VSSWNWPRLAALCLLAACLKAQSTGGVFRGEVRDPSDATVFQAKIVIHSQDTGAEVFAESNSDGLYLSPSLIPGSYILSASKPGFKSEEFGPVLLEVNQVVRVDFALPIGSTTEAIQVNAGGEQLLSTEGAQIGQVIAQQTVAEAPLNGRSWQQLIDLSAGVNPGAPGETGSPNPVNVNGQRTKANLFLADGMTVTSIVRSKRCESSRAKPVLIPPSMVT
jgi:hypothetical protein